VQEGTRVREERRAEAAAVGIGSRVSEADFVSQGLPE
jgi:hypothetical protein